MSIAGQQWPIAHQGVLVLSHKEWVKQLQEQLNEHDYSPENAGAHLSFGASRVSIEGCVLIAATVVETMMRDPEIVANAIVHLNKDHRDQIRVLLDKLADVGM